MWLATKELIRLVFFSLKGDNVYQFEGDRTRDEIVAFAQRLMGPAVRTISSTDELLSTVRKREIAFAFIGEPEGRLWVRTLLITWHS